MSVKLAQRMLRLAMGPFMDRIGALEDGVASMPGAYRSVADSPVRFEIMREKMKRENDGPDPATAPLVPPTILGVLRSMASLKENPERPKTRVPEGFLVDLDRPEEFTLALREVLADPVTAQEMGKNGRRITISNFSWEKVAEEYLKLFQ